jgi:hypothetical protein
LNLKLNSDAGSDSLTFVMHVSVHTGAVFTLKQDENSIINDFISTGFKMFSEMLNLTLESLHELKNHLEVISLLLNFQQFIMFCEKHAINFISNDLACFVFTKQAIISNQ